MKRTEYSLTFNDCNGIPRFWATGDTWSEVVNNAVNQASEYAIERPDLVPFSLSGTVDLCPKRRGFVGTIINDH